MGSVDCVGVVVLYLVLHMVSFSVMVWFVYMLVVLWLLVFGKPRSYNGHHKCML